MEGIYYAFHKQSKLNHHLMLLEMLLERVCRYSLKGKSGAITAKEALTLVPVKPKE
jgi:hypothetical protein